MKPDAKLIKDLNLLDICVERGELKRDSATEKQLRNEAFRRFFERKEQQRSEQGERV